MLDVSTLTFVLADDKIVIFTVVFAKSSLPTEGFLDVISQNVFVGMVFIV